MSEVTEIYAHLAAYDADINQLNAQRSDPGDGGTVGVKRECGDPRKGDRFFFFSRSSTMLTAV
jgi:hypothetical protein